MEIRVYRIGKLYSRQVRELHYSHGATLRESSGILQSHFLVHGSDPASSELIRTLDRFVARIAAMDAEEEAERQRRLTLRSRGWLRRLFDRWGAPS